MNLSDILSQTSHSLHQQIEGSGIESASIYDQDNSLVGIIWKHLDQKPHGMNAKQAECIIQLYQYAQKHHVWIIGGISSFGADLNQAELSLYLFSEVLDCIREYNTTGNSIHIAYNTLAGGNSLMFALANWKLALVETKICISGPINMMKAEHYSEKPSIKANKSDFDLPLFTSLSDACLTAISIQEFLNNPKEYKYSSISKDIPKQLQKWNSEDRTGKFIQYRPQQTHSIITAFSSFNNNQIGLICSNELQFGGSIGNQELRKSILFIKSCIHKKFPIIILLNSVGLRLDSETIQNEFLHLSSELIDLIYQVQPYVYLNENCIGGVYELFCRQNSKFIGANYGTNISAMHTDFLKENGFNQNNQGPEKAVELGLIHQVCTFSEFIQQIS